MEGLTAMHFNELNDHVAQIHSLPHVSLPKSAHLQFVYIYFLTLPTALTFPFAADVSFPHKNKESE